MTVSELYWSLKDHKRSTTVENAVERSDHERLGTFELGNNNALELKMENVRVNASKTKFNSDFFVFEVC